MPTTTAPASHGAPSTDRKPSGRQMYAIAYALLEIAGIDAPTNRAEASTIIDRLNEQRTAATAESAPF